MLNFLEQFSGIRFRPFKRDPFEVYAAEFDRKETIFSREEQIPEMGIDAVAAQIIHLAQNGNFALLTGRPEQTDAVMETIARLVDEEKPHQPFDIIPLTVRSNGQENGYAQTFFDYHPPGEMDQAYPFATTGPDGVILNPGEALLEKYVPQRRGVLFVINSTGDSETPIQSISAMLMNAWDERRTGEKPNIDLYRGSFLLVQEEPLNQDGNLPLRVPFHQFSV